MTLASQPHPLRVAGLASGRGSNLQALIDAQRAGTLPIEFVLVASDKVHAHALRRAEAVGAVEHAAQRQEPGRCGAVALRLLGADARRAERRAEHVPREHEAGIRGHDGLHHRAQPSRWPKRRALVAR